MDGPRFENPKVISGANAMGFATGNANKAMVGSDAGLKPLGTTIMDRFKAMMKAREDEVRVSDDEVVFLSSEKVVRIYEILLSELTFNSKPVITDLTIIAGEQREHGEGIADVICARILEVPVEQKLPSLYLLDSIAKNIGDNYIKHFSARLPDVFCEAYRQVHPNMYASMRHLFKTWFVVFPSYVLRKIEARLQFSPTSNNQASGVNSVRASDSPRPSHGIHVNPKYLEARRQIGDTTADAGGGEIVSSRVHSGNAATGLGAAKLLSSAARVARPSPPFGIKNARSLSPPLDDVAMSASPGRAAKKLSPSHSGFSYGYSRAPGRHLEASDLQRDILPDDTSLKSETSAYRYSNGIDLDRPRALIDAYGMDDRQKPQKDKHLKAVNPNVNGILKSASFKTWQNTEEEEFNWEDMAPASGDNGRSNDLFSSSIPPPANLGKRPGFGTYPDAALGPSNFRSNWSKQVQVPVLNGMSSRVEVSAINSGRVLNNRFPGFHNENVPQNDLQSPQHDFSVKGNGRTSQIPFSGNGMPSSVEQKASLVGNLPIADARIRGPSVVPTLGSSFDPFSHGTKPAVVPASVGALPPQSIQSSYRQATLANPLKHDKLGYQPEAVGNQGMSMSKLPGRRLGTLDSNLPNQIPQFPNQLQGLNPLNQKVRPHVNLLHPQPLLSQEARHNMITPVPFLAPAPLVRPTLNHGYVSQAQGVRAQIGTVLPNLIPSIQSSMSIPIPSAVNGSINLPGGGLPHLQQGFPLAASKILPISQNPGPIAVNTPAGGAGALSGLFDSLMAQGLISLTKDAPAQDSMGLDFNQDFLKLRHESAITALYGDLPRQCTACGLRFKCQEAHSNHMDWHVTRNRNISKNRKQRPSRKWFVDVDTWLSSAETLGVDAVPGFLPVENNVERNDDEEMAVPADDDQKVCALCGEPFDDFYSDEAEEWMYKGAMYLNAPSGSTSGLDRSELGPIVHSKCRSETSGASAQDFQNDDGGYNEEGGERKRLRS